MPKLMYFGLQGRAQAIRFLLGAKGVEFEDQHLGFAEWGPIKASGQYGESSLPIWVCDDGKFVNQSICILKMLAFEHGYMPETAQQVYESEWLYCTSVDIIEKPERMALAKDDATEEAQQTCIALLSNFLKKVDAHMADGRAHCCGDKITHADFVLLALVLGSYENPNGKHELIRNGTAAVLAECTNV